MSTLFISIASFVDPMLFFTVCRALHRAKYPERLRIGILDQGTRDQSALFRHPQIRYRFVHAQKSQGVCWARAEVQKLFEQENFYLQIDSHTDFAEDWDVVLEDTLRDLESRYDKPVLSTYPPGFKIKPDGQIHYPPTNTSYALGLVPAKGAVMTQDDPVFLFQAVWAAATHPPLGFHVAGGFIFARGQWVNEVPYDPNLYFHGEEQNIALRAFTFGWNIFHPIHIPLWHLYKASGQSHINHHWHPQWEADRLVKWTERQQQAKQRMNDLLAGRIPAGSPYGLGPLRNLAIFRDFCGIDYEKRQINRNQHAWLPLPS